MNGFSGFGNSPAKQASPMKDDPAAGKKHNHPLDKNPPKSGDVTYASTGATTKEEHVKLVLAMLEAEKKAQRKANLKEGFDTDAAIFGFDESDTPEILKNKRKRGSMEGYYKDNPELDER